MKYLIYLLGTLLLVTPVEAKKKNNNKQAAKRAKQEQQQKDQKKRERDQRRNAVKDVLDAKDKNHDGSLTKDEYISGEANPAAAAKRFDEYNKNRDRYLSKSEIQDSLGL